MARILLADDSAHAQRMGAKILSAEGHEVITVSNGQAALSQLRESVPDLVVADIFMPGRNGYEVCQFVKSEPQLKHVPVLLLIGAMEPYDPDEGRKVQADGLITKPLNSSDLVSTVQQLLANAPQPAPAPPKPASAAATKIAEESLQEETAEWEAVGTEETAMMARERLEIPEEIGEQPVGAFDDLLEPEFAAENPANVSQPLRTEEITSAESLDLETEFAAAAGEEPVLELEELPILPAEPFLEQALEAVGGDSLAVEEPPPAESVPGLIAADTLDGLAVAEKQVWTAEPAPVTEQDEKLFDPATSDWGNLKQMVEEEEKGDQIQERSEPSSSPGLETFQAPPLFPESTEREESAAVTAVQEPFPPRGEAQTPVSVALDRSSLEPLVRQSLESLIPEIVNRVAQALGIPLPERQKPSN